MKTPVNSRTLRQHLAYSWWKYAMVIVLGAMAVNLYFTVTAYKPPEEKKVLMYVYGVSDETALNGYMDSVRSEQLPEMEEMYSLTLSTDGTYGPMQLSTYVAAGEGDLYILPRDQFVSLATSGAWVALEEDTELTSIFAERDLSLQSGWRRDPDSGVSHLYGIPISQLPGLQRYVYVENGYLCALITNGNDDNVLKFMRILCGDMLDAPPAAEGAPEASDPQASPESAAPETTEPAE